MPDEMTQDVEQADEQIPDNEENEAPETPETEADNGPSDSELKWDETVPDMKGMYSELSPEARERILRERLAASSTQQTSPDDTEGEESTAGEPSVPELPELDRFATLSSLKTAVEDGDGESAYKALDQWMEWDSALMQTVAQAMRQQDEQIEALRSELNAPRKMTQALRDPAVRQAGATDADVDRARELMESGEVASEKAALRLAAYERGGRAKPKDSKRTASSVRASQAGSGRAQGRAMKDTGVVTSFTSSAGRALIEEMEKEQQSKRR